MTGKELKEYRNEHDYSQQAFAKKIGVHWTTLSAWETGKRPIAEKYLALLRSALKLDLTLTEAQSHYVLQTLISRKRVRTEEVRQILLGMDSELERLQERVVFLQRAANGKG